MTYGSIHQISEVILSQGSCYFRSVIFLVDTYFVPFAS